MTMDQTASDDFPLAGLALVTVPDHWVPPGGRTAPLPAAGPDGPVGPPGSQPSARERTWAQQFAVLLAEALAGLRPARQILPWLSKRGSAQLHRLMPLFGSGQRPRVVRVLTSMPHPDVIEMTMVVHTGSRVRALAARLERPAAPEPPGAQTPPGVGAGTGPAAARPGATAPWICTDIEAG
jgi:Family of unknown function (DUF6459)